MPMDELESLIYQFCNNCDDGKEVILLEGKLDESNKYVIRLPNQLHKQFHEFFKILDDQS